MPSLPLSPDRSDDSVTVIMGSSREESITPSEVIVIGPPDGDVLPVPTNLYILDQYALSLQGTALKMLERSLGASDGCGGGCPRPSGPPCFRSDGGYGAVAALVGPYTSELGCLVPGCLDYHELICH